MWQKALRFVWRMVRDFFFGVGVFVFLSILDVPLFSSETILVDGAFLYVLFEAGGPDFFYLLFGSCCGVFVCYIDCLFLLSRSVEDEGATVPPQRKENGKDYQ